MLNFEGEKDVMHTEKDDDFNKLFSRIEKYENISDNMELEILEAINLLKMP